ncbi:MAG TPA: hypothetical protein VF043_02250 [Ktedonobacteraceae bacterium]
MKEEPPGFQPGECQMMIKVSHEPPLAKRGLAARPRAELQALDMTRLSQGLLYRQEAIGLR